MLTRCNCKLEIIIITKREETTIKYLLKINNRLKRKLIILCPNSLPNKLTHQENALNLSISMTTINF